jgi:hypothetical protein
MLHMATKSADESFQYAALDHAERQVRLLSISPGPQDAPVQTTLSVISLSFRPNYEALSYAWGSESVSNDIEVNGTCCKVTRNLHDALSHVRRPDAETVIWVDALCIDQSNAKEKTQQVTLMGEIYAQCTQVLIWLGHPQPNLGVAAICASLIQERRRRTTAEDYKCSEGYHSRLMS